MTSKSREGGSKRYGWDGGNNVFEMHAEDGDPLASSYQQATYLDNITGVPQRCLEQEREKRLLGPNPRRAMDSVPL